MFSNAHLYLGPFTRMNSRKFPVTVWTGGADRSDPTTRDLFRRAVIGWYEGSMSLFCTQIIERFHEVLCFGGKN
jgi:hypothetical protein